MKKHEANAIVIEGDKFDLFLEKLSSIEKILTEKTKPKAPGFFDQSEFERYMKVGKRTVQMWRDEGKISFSQIGSKIYYRFEDIEDFMNRNYSKSFKNKK